MSFTGTGVPGAVQPSSLTGAEANTKFQQFSLTSGEHLKIF